MGGATPGRRELDIWWRIARATVAVLCRVAFRFRFVGLERIPAAGPAILACNHVSVLDPVILAIAVSDRGRTVRFLAAAELFDKPFIGWALRRMGQIPIRRGARDRGALEEAAGVIRSGALAGIFPEGRMGEGDALQPGQKGVARMALAAGVPVVPVAIWGSQVRWPRSGIRFRPLSPLRPKVAIVAGNPIPVEGSPRAPRQVRDLTERIMSDIGELVERARDVAR
jgi:1-acyl-sn-glycerol-3-phosphate acyltransferase